MSKKGLKYKDFIMKQLKRGGFVLTLALVITMTTWLVIPESYVYFGILHLIGLSILLLIPFVNRPYLAGLISLITIVLISLCILLI